MYPQQITNAMLRPIIFALLASISVTCNAQEFAEHSNGLIYSDTTIRELRFIVDSMNLKYKKCDPWKTYYSISQGIANFISLDSVNVEEARQDIENNISYAGFKRKYSMAETHENIPVIRYPETNYNDETVTEFSVVEFGDLAGYSIQLKDTTYYTKDVTGKWILEYTPKGGYSNGHISAFYFPEGFTCSRMPAKYERMIQYVDCMIDTNSTIFTNKAKRDYRYRGINETDSTPHAKKFFAFLAQYRSKKGTLSDSAEQAVATTPVFATLLHDAAEEALRIGHTSEQLEYYIERYESKQHALILKRGRIVVGGCSQDQRPREHAWDIARLSAEAVSWDIFLRAHLDIMNDRFPRVSDGSYAWGARNTYIRELEQLNFDVTTLLLGTSMRISNPSGTHYYGSIGRLGRALSESANAAEVEKQMADAITDPQLDHYNRILFFYLYRSYIYHLKDKSKIKPCLATLRSSVASLPPYISEHITLDDKDFERK